MEHKHTPGPWRYELGRNDRPPYVIRGSEGGCVVVGMTAARQDADARLIAAAPDLLAALESIVSDHEFCGDDWGSRRDAWIETARAAITKATKEPA